MRNSHAIDQTMDAGGDWDPPGTSAAPLRPPCPAGGLGATPIGRQGCWSRHRLRGPPSKAPSGRVRPAASGRPVVGSRHSFLLFPSSRRRGVGDIPLNRPRGRMGCDGRGGGWLTPTQIRERQTGPGRQQAKHLGVSSHVFLPPPLVAVFSV